MVKAKSQLNQEGKVDREEEHTIERTQTGQLDRPWNRCNLTRARIELAGCIERFIEQKVRTPDTVS